MGKNLVVVIDDNPVVVLDLSQTLLDLVPDSVVQTFGTFDEAAGMAGFESAYLVVAPMPCIRKAGVSIADFPTKYGMRLILMTDRTDYEPAKGIVFVPSAFSSEMISEAVFRLIDGQH